MVVRDWAIIGLLFFSLLFLVFFIRELEKIKRSIRSLQEEEERKDDDCS